MLKILAATGNQHKIQEFRSLLDGLDIQILSAKEIPGFPEIIEDGTTFEENSAKKASEASAFAGMTAFADDSGLQVDALDGAPGVYSARYAGPGASDADRVRKLLREMEGKTDRTARFVCVVTIADNGRVIRAFRGEIRGRIIDSPRGEHGFGYDPVFVPDGFDRTFAELTMEEKGRVSHRAIAMKQAADFLRREYRKN